MKFNTRNGLKFFFGCLVSICLLWFSLRGINWKETGATLSRIDIRSIFLIFLLFVSFFVIKAFRWRLLLRPVIPKTIGDIFPIMMIGVALNAALSIVVGEIVRSYILGKRFKISKTSILATILLERLMDVLTLLIFLIIAIFFSFVHFSEIWLILYLGLVFSVASTVIIFVIWKEQCLTILSKLLFWLPLSIKRVGRTKLESGFTGLQAIAQPTLLLKVFVMSLLQWIVMATINLISIIAIGIHVPFSAAIFVMVINAFALILPAGPGYLGVFEFGFVVGLETFNIDVSEAIAAALIFHSIYLITLAALAIPSWFLFKNGKE